ncbi:phospholipase D-like domain-containing protein [Sphingosinicella sp. YJ22]|uniref:phospholipase D-like domain-containing protein n=1 Tax=Sphingosinicella sp. YJ22 TaxID=1104780 RepID=UPI00140B0E58|nr:phospholipase D-like domain-containing protein [Sphingosinicella sp. YJ22]
MNDSPVRVSESHGLEPGRNCWRIARADKAALIVDAADYFAVVRQAMMTAEKRIMLIGWDFDARVRIGPRRNPTGAPSTIGRFVLWLNNHRPDLNVYLLRWDFGAFKALFRGTTPITVARWALHKRIHVKLDAAHPWGASHHQKIVVIDDCLAFCGGIDITSERWDTRAHLDNDPRRVKPHGNPAIPWHDATLALSGPAAQALDELARERWRCAGGGELEPINRCAQLWPQGLEPQFENVDVAIARTRPNFGDVEAVHEIEELYLDMIARAKRFVYIEGQYFASGRVAEAITRRLTEEDGPEFVVVSPESAHGRLEQVAMDTARSRLFEAVKQYDRHNRFRVYTPCTERGMAIYVHAKIMVVDDIMLRVGSSNLNNRSMRLDTECDVVLDATLPGQAHIAATIRAIRDDLAAEHLDVTPDEFARMFDATESLIEAVEQLRGQGRTLKPYLPPALTRLGTFLAERQLLDPDGPEQTFDPFARRSLFRRLRRPPPSG